MQLSKTPLTAHLGIDEALSLMATPKQDSGIGIEEYERSHAEMYEAINNCLAIDDGESIGDPIAELKYYAAIAQNFEPERMAIQIRIKAEKKIKKMFNNTTKQQPEPKIRTLEESEAIIKKGLATMTEEQQQLLFNSVLS